MILSVTGHRSNKLGGYSEEARFTLDSFAAEMLRKLSPDKIITGMALGWDTAIATSCLNLGIPYIAAIPFEGQERRWKLEDKELYHHLLEYADKVVDVSLEVDDKLPPLTFPTYYQHRNEWMVDNSDVLLALWNGGNGGTANCVRYAKGKRLTINAWEMWCARHENKIHTK
jgi:uncharacterized phage-like protein YoqJ